MSVINLYDLCKRASVAGAVIATSDLEVGIRHDLLDEHGQLTPKGKATITAGTPGARPTPSAPALDVQIGGDHYKKLGQYQPWQVAAACMSPAELRGYMKGTVLAYLMREGDKGGDLDIEKARHTIELWQSVRKDK